MSKKSIESVAKVKPQGLQRADELTLDDIKLAIDILTWWCEDDKVGEKVRKESDDEFWITDCLQSCQSPSGAPSLLYRNVNSDGSLGNLVLVIPLEDIKDDNDVAELFPDTLTWYLSHSPKDLNFSEENDERVVVIEVDTSNPSKYDYMQVELEPVKMDAIIFTVNGKWLWDTVNRGDRDVFNDGDDDDVEIIYDDNDYDEDEADDEDDDWGEEGDDAHNEYFEGEGYRDHYYDDDKDDDDSRQPFSYPPIDEYWDTAKIGLTFDAAFVVRDIIRQLSTLDGVATIDRTKLNFLSYINSFVYTVKAEGTLFPKLVIPLHPTIYTGDLQNIIDVCTENTVLTLIPRNLNLDGNNTAVGDTTTEYQLCISIPLHEPFDHEGSDWADYYIKPIDANAGYELHRFSLGDLLAVRDYINNEVGHPPQLGDLVTKDIGEQKVTKTVDSW